MWKKFQTLLFLFGIVSGSLFVALPAKQIQAATLTYVGGAEASGNSTSFNVSLTGLTGGIASAPVEGDLVVVITGFVAITNGNPGVSTAGYTEVSDLYANDTRDANMSVSWKIMTASPDTSVNCNGSGTATNGAVCIVHVWRNADPVTPFDVADTEVIGINAAIPNSPSITPVTAGAVVLSAGLGTGAANDTSVTAPAGYSNQVDISVDPGNAAIVAVASKAWSGSGAEDPAAWTNWTTSTSDSWAAVTLALRPSLTAIYEQSAYRLFDNANATDVGTPLAVQDTAATLAASGGAFRLRMLMHVGDAQLASSGESFKLQFAARSGTCDTGFSGETYSDVTSITAIAYNTANTPADGDNLTANANDPTHSGHTIVNQDYEEANNFTNTVAAVPAGQDGKWDFVLKDNGAPSGTAYCFRMRKADGSALDTYTLIPEVVTASTASQSLTFSISDNTIGFGTLSSSAARYATGDTLGASSDTANAHTISAATNAASGYVITLSGNTLTCAACGNATINAIGGTAVASSPGSEQFGLRLLVSTGNGTVAAPYNSANWALDTSAFPDQVATGSGDNTTTTFGVRYIGNISGTTEAGAYSAVLTYTATANF